MWFFRSPTVVFGDEALSYLSSLPIHRALIVTDRHLMSTDVPEKVRQSLPRDAQTLVLGDVGAEPDLEEMTAHLDELRRFAPDWIVGVGGGSALDTAKILFVLYERPDLTVYDTTPLQPLGLRAKSRLIAVPTTSGTGSECTWAAVLTERAEKRKHELASPEIIPDYAILDPEMVLSLPLEQTRNTAVDAITHAIEAYVSQWKNPYSDAMAEKGLELILGNIVAVVKEPGNRPARNAVHIGASMAGLSFSNSQIGLAHALGHALGGRYKTPHGKAVGIFLPLVIEFNQPVCGERFERLNRLFPAELRAPTLAGSVRNLFRSIGQDATVASLGIARAQYLSDIDELASLAAESTGLVTNPRDSGTAELKEILEHAFAGGDPP